MSDLTFAWVVTFAAVLLGWAARVVDEYWLDAIPTAILTAVGAGLLIALVERRLRSARGGLPGGR